MNEISKWEPQLHAERLHLHGNNVSPIWMAMTRTSAAHRQINPEIYIPSIPMGASSIRLQGLKIWDLMAMCRSSAETNKVDAHEQYLRQIKPRKHLATNDTWIDYDNDRERHRYVFSIKDSISLPHYLDLSKEEFAQDAFRIYELAHILMHRWADPIAATMGVKFRPSIYSRFLRLAMAHLLVSKEFDTPIYIGDGEQRKTWLPPSPAGIMVCTGDGISDPVFGIPQQEVLHRDRVDAAVAYVFVAIHMQPPPELFLSSVPMVDLVWSMGPMRALVVGWEFIDFVYSGPLVTRGKLSPRKVVGVHPNDMLPPWMLSQYMEAVPPASGSLYSTFRQLMSENDMYMRMRAAIHPLPFPPALSFGSLKSMATDPNEEGALMKRAMRMVRKATKVYEEEWYRREPSMEMARTVRKSIWSGRMAAFRDRYKQLKRDGQL